MSKLKTATIPDHHKVQAKALLNEAIDEAPDTVIVLCFWKDKGQFKIKTSTASAVIEQLHVGVVLIDLHCYTRLVLPWQKVSNNTRGNDYK